MALDRRAVLAAFLKSWRASAGAGLPAERSALMRAVGARSGEWCGFAAAAWLLAGGLKRALVDDCYSTGSLIYTLSGGKLGFRVAGRNVKEDVAGRWFELGQAALERAQPGDIVFWKWKGSTVQPCNHISLFVRVLVKGGRHFLLTAEGNGTGYGPDKRPRSSAIVIRVTELGTAAATQIFGAGGWGPSDASSAADGMAAAAQQVM